jgi:hypothetical protein
VVRVSVAWPEMELPRTRERGVDANYLTWRAGIVKEACPPSTGVAKVYVSPSTNASARALRPATTALINSLPP